MNTIEAKLKALARLQFMDSNLDKILTLRGSLPEEVSDLEFDIQGLEGRKERIEADIKALQNEITKKKNNIKDFEAQIKKYESQLGGVKNNREYEALNKEIEYANLEILTSVKKIKQFEDQIGQKEGHRDDTQEQIDERNQDLQAKQKELEVIVKETELEEQRLKATSDTARETVEKRVLTAYDKIRRNMRNGLAVVTTDRNACGGCFAIIPPQLHLEIRQRSRLIICENCGRMLVDRGFFDELAEENAAATTAPQST